MPTCPICISSQTVNNGRIQNGKQRFKCPECGRQFVEHPQNKVLDSASRELIDRWLLERISLGKETGLTSYIERFNNTLPQRVSCLVPKTLSNFYVFRESHWCHLVFHPSLQRVITGVALPSYTIFLKM